MSAAQAPVTTQAASQSSEAERAWATAKDSTDPTVLEAFIVRFKGTFYADLARSRLTKLKVATTTLAPQRTEQTDHAAAVTPPKSGATPPELQAIDAIEASQFRWKYDCSVSHCYYPSAYTFILRNKTQNTLANIKYVVIFYGRNGSPIHSVEGEFVGDLLGYLAKSLDSDLGGNAPYPGHHVRERANSAEVRVLAYKLKGN